MKKLLLTALLVLGLIGTSESIYANQCLNTEVTVDFSSDLQSFEAKSSIKDISNIVVFFDDGTEKKYDNLTEQEYEYFENDSITKVCVKTGCNSSDEGPGYGEACFNACPTQDLSVTDYEAFEGTASRGTPFTNFIFSVQLSEPVPTAGCAIELDYTTVDGTAVAGEDFQAAAGSLVIGEGEIVGTVDVTVIGDSLIEDNEIFTVDFENVKDPSVTATATGSILNDDAQEF